MLFKKLAIQLFPSMIWTLWRVRKRGWHSLSFCPQTENIESQLIPKNLVKNWTHLYEAPQLSAKTVFVELWIFNRRKTLLPFSTEKTSKETDF